ncbi:MAG: dephospho-CoA kinase [Candidatus Promineofilum sp.]|nr:dephospho-CoA kinase [Promineifilum sp.]
MNRRIIIGLTGNIATGKSAVMKLAAEHGALVIDADRVVHELLQRDEDIQTAVVAAFGPEVRLPDGRIDRAAVGRIVFGDEQALRRLEDILHPAVREEIARRVATSEAPIVMIEAIKLLEGPLAAVCDQVWVTTCSRATQLERLRVCRGMDDASAVARVEAQSPQEEKIGRADVVIHTDGLMSATQEQFEVAWSNLSSPARDVT